MTLIQGLCAAILAVYLAFALRRQAAPALLRRLGLLAGAAWLAEDSAIRVYGFYAYDAGWALPLDQTPLLIVLIWPVVIHSAEQLVSALSPRGRCVPLLTAALVLADASLMEPIAVQAGLWRWTVPGFFEVPIIGVLGWAYFTFAAVTWFAFVERRRAGWLPECAVLLVAPLATHALLLATWWGGLRAVAFPLAAAPLVLGAWGLSLGLTALIVRGRLWRRVPLATLAQRMPAAAFFLGLLFVFGHQRPELVAFALAFVPPYLVLTPWARVRASR